MTTGFLWTDRVLHKQIVDFCSHLAGSKEILALSIFEYCSAETSHSKGALEVVQIVKDLPQRIMSYVKNMSDRTVVVLTVDQWIFERDVDRGFMGEAFAANLLLPNTTLVGQGYLHSQEIKLKRRLVLELLESLTLSYPELLYQIRIRPEYFMYEVLMRRVRVFPPMAECVSSFMQESKHKGEEENSILAGYVQALHQLEKERKVRFVDGYVTVPKRLFSESDKPRIWLANLFRSAPRTLFTPIFKVFPQLLSLFNQTPESILKFQSFDQWKKNLEVTRSFIDPQEYIFVPTAKGLDSLANRENVESFAREKLLNGKKGDVKLEAVGGVLNDVYIVKVESPDGKQRVLVKRFKDWSGFKWFPLNLWSLGTLKFAVAGKSRLERECATSELLRNEGFNVPKILHVSNMERLVFMEYLEGENLTKSIKRFAASKRKDLSAKENETFNNVGKTLARVHLLGVTLGDTKPENVILGNDGRVYLLDFEQASHGGDKSWDVAEFLYFSGHYLPPFGESSKAVALVSAFIRGYVEGGGEVNVVKKAASSKYTRVFSLFTPPSVLASMSATCKKVEG